MFWLILPLTTYAVVYQGKVKGDGSELTGVIHVEVDPYFTALYVYGDVVKIDENGDLTLSETNTMDDYFEVVGNDVMPRGILYKIVGSDNLFELVGNDIMPREPIFKVIGNEIEQI